MLNGITLITPTGDRYVAFKLCETWISRQTLQPNQWIVVDDGVTREAGCTLGQDCVRRTRERGEPPHTLHLNLLTALPLIKYNHILIIEDDDYYAPTYIEHMNNLLAHNHIAGQGESIYYNIRDRNFRQLHNRNHVSLCQTGFTEYNISKLEQVCNIINQEHKKGQSLPMVDILFWRNAAGKRHIEVGTKKLCIGIKGLPGRKGIGMGHDRFETNDYNFELLKTIMGNDANVYIEVSKLPEIESTVGDASIMNQRQAVIHKLLRARQIRRLVTGDFALLRHNDQTLRILNENCVKIDKSTWRLKKDLSESNFMATQVGKYKNKTCYIIGKGPGLDTIPFEDESLFKPDCPIIAVNEAIHTAEAKRDYPNNPLFCLQQDTVLRERCWSKKGTMLVPFSLRWYLEHPKVIVYNHADFPLLDRRFPFSVEMSIYIAKCWECSDIVFMACDAAVTKNCDYAKAIGHEPAGNKDRYLMHLKYINKALGTTPHTYNYPHSK